MVDWWVALLAAAAAAWWVGVATDARYLRPLARAALAADGPSTALEVADRIAALGCPRPDEARVVATLRQLEREGRVAVDGVLPAGVARGARLRYRLVGAAAAPPAERFDDAP